jgi:hypothetical protein
MSGDSLAVATFCITKWGGPGWPSPARLIAPCCLRSGRHVRRHRLAKAQEIRQKPTSTRLDGCNQIRESPIPFCTPESHWSCFFGRARRGHRDSLVRRKCLRFNFSFPVQALSSSLCCVHSALGQGALFPADLLSIVGRTMFHHTTAVRRYLIKAPRCAVRHAQQQVRLHSCLLRQPEPRDRVSSRFVAPCHRRGSQLRSTATSRAARISRPAKIRPAFKLTFKRRML